MTLHDSLKTALRQHPELAQALSDPNYGKGFAEAPVSGKSPLSKDRKGVVHVVKSKNNAPRAASTARGTKPSKEAQQ